MSKGNGEYVTSGNYDRKNEKNDYGHRNNVHMMNNLEIQNSEDVPIERNRRADVLATVYFGFMTSFTAAISFMGLVIDDAQRFHIFCNLLKITTSLTLLSTIILPKYSFTEVMRHQASGLCSFLGMNVFIVLGGIVSILMGFSFEHSAMGAVYFVSGGCSIVAVLIFIITFPTSTK